MERMAQHILEVQAEKLQSLFGDSARTVNPNNPVELGEITDDMFDDKPIMIWPYAPRELSYGEISDVKEDIVTQFGTQALAYEVKDQMGYLPVIGDAISGAIFGGMAIATGSWMWGIFGFQSLKSAFTDYKMLKEAKARKHIAEDVALGLDVYQGTNDLFQHQINTLYDVFENAHGSEAEIYKDMWDASKELDMPEVATFYQDQYALALENWPGVLNNFGLIDINDSLALFQRGAENKFNLIKTHDQAPRISFIKNMTSENLEFIGYNKNNKTYELFWQSSIKDKTNYYLRLSINKDNKIFYQKTYPLGYGLFEGKKIIQTNYWFEFPKTLASAVYTLKIDVVDIQSGGIEIDAIRSTENIIDDEIIILQEIINEEINL